MQELNCNQVIALLTFFSDQKLNPNLMESIEYHLRFCPACREKYLNLQKLISNYQEIKNRIIEDDCDEAEAISYKDKQYKLFKENLSAYIDNELSDKENLRIKKIAIANTDARQDLEDILSVRELILTSFQKTKENLKTDLSEQTINKAFKQQCFSTDEYSEVSPKYLPLLICVISLIIITISYCIFS